MATALVKGVRLAGVCASVPLHEECNTEYAHLPPEDRRKIIQTTGIDRRRVAPDGVCTSDLCAAATNALLDRLEWRREDVDALVLVTQTPDYAIPATAPILQDRLGLPKTTLAFDVNLGCSGYTYGLQIVASLLAAGGLNRGLLLVGDTLSKNIARTDRTAAPLFGDAAAATALEASPDASMYFDAGTDGSGFEAIIMPDGGSRNPVSHESFDPVEFQTGVVRNRMQLALDGVEIFNFSMREVPKTVRSVLSLAKRDASAVDAFVFHQANRFMNERITDKLKLDAARVPSSLGVFGNTGSASIPLTLVTELRSQLESDPMTLLLCGFGVGLSWSTVLLETARVACPPLVQVPA